MAETPSSEDRPSGLHYTVFGLASVTERTDMITRVFVTLHSIPVYHRASGPVRFDTPTLVILVAEAKQLPLGSLPSRRGPTRMRPAARLCASGSLVPMALPSSLRLRDADCLKSYYSG
jgi:hypothetical protein